MRAPHPHLRGFSLLELLVVLTIMGLLASLGVLALKPLTSSQNLNSAGDKVAGLLAFAREEAIAKNTMTAVVLVTSPTQSTASYRTFSVWELALPATGGAPTSANWFQATKWQSLPFGTTLDSGSPSSNNFATSMTVTPALPATITYLGTPLSTTGSAVAVQYFLPSGQLDWSSSNNLTIQLVEGYYNGTSTVYTHVSPTNSTLPADYIQYVLIPATGEAKVVRP
jgi:prepilin-type N-terminal cleavage/methylation domain-containing protein